MNIVDELLLEDNFRGEANLKHKNIHSHNCNIGLKKKSISTTTYTQGTGFAVMMADYFWQDKR